MVTKLHTYYDSFAERLKKLRKEKYKTQQDFADALGVSIESVRNWEQGRIIPEMNRLFSICSHLNCDLDYLIGRLESKTHDLAFIHDQIGLDLSVIEKLQDWNKRENTKTMYLSEIMTHERFPELMNELCEYMGLQKMEAKGYSSLSGSDVSEIIDLEMARLWHLQIIFTDIVESIGQQKRVKEYSE